MVKYMLLITADLENLTDLQPQGGCDDPNFSYLFKLKCENCGEVTQKETCVVLNETVPLQAGKGTTNLSQKCKFCGREGTVTMITRQGHPLTLETSESGTFTPLMLFDCRGYEPIDYVFGYGWKVESIQGTKFENVDLSSEDFVEYDEKGAHVPPCAILEVLKLIQYGVLLKTRNSATMWRTQRCGRANTILKRSLSSVE